MPVRQNIKVIRPFQVPLRIPSIDWSKPITNGLIGLWVPGAWGPFDLTNRLPVMVNSGGATWGVGREGRALSSPNVSGAGYSALIGNGAAYSQYVAFTTLSLWWRGQVLGAPSNNAIIFGINYNSTETNPFLIAAFDTDNTGANYRLDYNVSGVFSTATIGAVPAAPSIVSLIGTFQVVVSAGTALGYLNGVAGSSNSFGAVPNSTSTSTLVLGADPVTLSRTSNSLTYICGIWNRVLSAQEIVTLGQDPYGFLVENDIKIAPHTAAAASSVFFRKTLSPIGTRVGSRQTMI